MARAPIRSLVGLAAAYVVGMWTIGLLAAAPNGTGLSEVLLLPFQLLLPVGVPGIALGAALLFFINRSRPATAVPYVIGCAFLPLATLLLLRAVNGASVAFVLSAPLFVLVLFVAGAVAGYVVWVIRRWGAEQ